MGERVEPCRARPVPFWRQGFLPPPRTSPRVFVCAQGSRAFACWASSTCFTSVARHFAPNTFSGSSTVPTFSLFKLKTSVCMCVLKLFPDFEQTAARTRHCALQKYQIVFFVDLRHREIFHRNPRAAHVARHAASRHHALECSRTDGTWCAVAVFLAVRLRAAGEVVPLHDALESTPLHDARYADLVPF